MWGELAILIVSLVSWRLGYILGSKHTRSRMEDLLSRSSCPHGIPFRYKWETVVNRSGICQECDNE